MAGERRDLAGFELASAVNLESGSVRGFQVAGLANLAAGDVEAFQLSAGANVAGGELRGFQLGGLYNCADAGAGVQLSAAVNRIRGRFSGLQLGLANLADESGVQIGIVNVARRARGLSLGLVSVEEGGILEGFARAEYAPGSAIRAGAGLKVGTRSVYSIFRAVIPVDEPAAWSASAGWGVRARLGPAVLDADLSWRSRQALVVGDRSGLRGDAALGAELGLAGFPLRVGGGAVLAIPGVSGNFAAAPIFWAALALGR